MSFSATILFSPPPGQNEGKCGCGKESSSQGGPIPPAAEGIIPITVAGQGVAVQGSEQLLHLIYQRVEKAVGLAEAALGVAKANGNLLSRLQEEVSGLKKMSEKPERPQTPVPTTVRCKTSEDEEPDEIRGVQVVIEELRQLGAASASLVPGLHSAPMERTTREGCLPTCPPLSESTPLLSPMHLPVTSSRNILRNEENICTKLVHNIHNHISNNKRFNGSESIKSSWNISVLKFLVEKLKQELVSSIHHYTDKELKGACVAYFLTKRREYRNSMNPFKSLREKEEKKLRSRRYRLFANRSWGVQQFPVEEQALWEGVTEELMSDEEDSLSEPGVWVARPPRFRSPELSRLCYSIDSHSKHGNKTNRVYGALSDRLPSTEVQLLPPHLYNPDWEREVEDDDDVDLESGERARKSYCPDLNSFIEIKVEKDE